MNNLIKIMLDLSVELNAVKKQVNNIQNTIPRFVKDSWLDGADVLQILRISNRTFQSLRDSRKLPYSKIKGKFYYKYSDIEKLLESNYSSLKSKSNEDK